MPAPAALLLLALALASRASLTDPDMSFLVIGDWGGQSKAPYTTNAQISVAAGMQVPFLFLGKTSQLTQPQIVAQEVNATFIVAVGDNFYSGGYNAKQRACRELACRDVFGFVILAPKCHVDLPLLHRRHSDGRPRSPLQGNL